MGKSIVPCVDMQLRQKNCDVHVVNVCIEYVGKEESIKCDNDDSRRY